MRVALWSLAAIIVTGAALIFVGPLFISAEDVRNKLFAEIESATGYRLIVNGPLHISAFPSLKLMAGDVSAVQSTGADTIDLATAKEVRFGLALAPLLSGKVQVTEVALIQPVVRLQEPAAKASTTGVTGATGASAGGTSLDTILKSFGLDSLRLNRDSAGRIACIGLVFPADRSDGRHRHVCGAREQRIVAESRVPWKRASRSESVCGRRLKVTAHRDEPFWSLS